MCLSAQLLPFFDSCLILVSTSVVYQPNTGAKLPCVADLVCVRTSGDGTRRITLKNYLEKKH